VVGLLVELGAGDECEGCKYNTSRKAFHPQLMLISTFFPPLTLEEQVALFIPEET
jgi:hypothetical protein